MPRRLRDFPPGCIIHVVNRGNDRRLLFANSLDYIEFLSMMRWAKSIEPVRLVAYVVMPNHWHFVIWVESSAQVSRFLHRLTGAHAARIRYETCTVGEGHIYQDRFHAFRVDGELSYLRLIGYVEANPLRASLVLRPEEWEWSSLAERLGQETLTSKRQLIDEGPLTLPIDWLDFIRQQQPAEVLADFRARQTRTQCGPWDRPARRRRRRI
jgi:putative transposase